MREFDALEEEFALATALILARSDAGLAGRLLQLGKAFVPE